MTSFSDMLYDAEKLNKGSEVTVKEEAYAVAVRGLSAHLRFFISP